MKVKCAKCKKQTHHSTAGTVVICNPCFKRWPKGDTLEEFLARALPAVSLPESPGLTIRQEFKLKMLNYTGQSE